MNLLLIYPDEIYGEELHLTGERAAWVRDTFRVATGDTVVCGVLNGAIGEARVTLVDTNRVSASLTLTRAAPRRVASEVIVGLSRPHTMKKTLQFAASAGISTVRLVRCDGSEKSYLDSHVLRPHDLAAELDLGLAQGVDTARPEVFVHQTLADAIEGFLAGQFAQAPTKLVGALQAGLPVTDPVLVHPPQIGAAYSSGAFAIAVGPEKGFSPRELGVLEQEAGFTRIQLGERQLRVEFALAALVGRCLTAIKPIPY